MRFNNCSSRFTYNIWSVLGKGFQAKVLFRIHWELFNNYLNTTQYSFSSVVVVVAAEFALYQIFVYFLERDPHRTFLCLYYL